jgi:cytidylate kinase
VARDVLKAGAQLGDCTAAARAAEFLDPQELADPELRRRGCGEAASVVAAIPQVRTALLAFQRAFASQPGGAVVEGRDIGTVVCPGADAKIFLTATLESRAQRRYLELLGYGIDITEGKVREEIAERDRRDTTRVVSPLRKAEDAHLLDTTGLDIEKAFLAAVNLIDAAAAGR